MALFIVLKKNVNLKVKHSSHKELLMKPLLRDSVPDERTAITSESKIEASNLYISSQSTD